MKIIAIHFLWSLVTSANASIPPLVAERVPVHQSEQAFDAGGWFASLSLRERRAVCGVHSAYVLLRLSGLPAKYVDVFDAFGVHGAGASMLLLREVTSNLGLPTSVRKCSYDYLSSIGRPFIAHTGAGSSFGGHYVVVVNVTSTSVRYIDGMTAEVKERSKDYFCYIWSGYILEVTEKHGWSLSMLLLTASTTVLGVVLLRVCRVARNVGARRGILAYLAALVALGSPMETSATVATATQLSSEQKVWRVQENDAKNCLYIYAKLKNPELKYDNVCEATGAWGNDMSLRDLREMAGAMGVASAVFECHTIDDLKEMAPGIVNVETERGDKYGFYVVSHIENGQVWVANGAYGTIERMAPDDFLRRWSGHLLAPASERDVKSASMLLIVAVAIGVIVCMRMQSHKAPSMRR